MNTKSSQPPAISVVIPTYNAAQWLPKSVPKVAQALKNANVKTAEILIVDDGSSDNSGQVAKGLKLPYPVRVVRQANAGRFLARKLGTDEAKYDHILFIDTRIYITPGGLKFIVEQLAKNPERQVWTSHVYLDKQSNIYARFWDALTSLAWRKYFKKPGDFSYGIKDFDYYPKGTTCFFVPKALFAEANTWFASNTKDLKTSNDDTLLIRRIAETTNININPKFSCTYHARSSFKQYVKHVFHRGKVFVDGFLRRDGNRFFWPLVFFLVLSVALPLFLILKPAYLLPLLVAAICLWLAELAICLLFGIGLEDSWSLTILTPVFVVFYGLGIWTAFIKIYILRSNRPKQQST